MSGMSMHNLGCLGDFQAAAVCFDVLQLEPKMTTPPMMAANAPATVARSNPIDRVNQPTSMPRLSVGYHASIIVASFGRAVAPNYPDLAWRQVTLFLPLLGYDPGSIIAEAEGPAIY